VSKSVQSPTITIYSRIVIEPIDAVWISYQFSIVANLSIHHAIPPNPLDLNDVRGIDYDSSACGALFLDRTVRLWTEAKEWAHFAMRFTFPNTANPDLAMLSELGDPSRAVSSCEKLFIPPFHEFATGYSVKDDLREPSSDEEHRLSVGNVSAHQFHVPKRVIADLNVAVDTSVLPLGLMRGGGVAFAIRGTAVCTSRTGYTILRYSTGAMLVTKHNKLALFRYIGERLGTPDLYVECKDGRLREKLSAIDNANRIQDRCRSFVERVIQQEALGLLAANGGGLLLIDGALTASFDTPVAYLRELLAFARDKRVEVCAISKRSGLAVGGNPVSALFDDYPTFVGYAGLMPALRSERDAYGTDGRTSRAITEATGVFAVRFGFGPPGLTYRVDVSKSYGSSDEDVLNTVYDRCVFQGGYPRDLIDAHQNSSFIGGEALVLLADLVVRTGATVKEDPTMSILFQPFGAYGK
jgi:hypothetical protein